MTKAKVTRRALIQRMNRKLEPQDLKICVSRGARMVQDYGEFHMINRSQDAIAGRHLPDLDALEEYARELGVLAKYEEIADGEA